MTEKGRAALYVRLSREDESEGQSQSITNQCALLGSYVQQQNIAVYDTYIDDGWSGTNFDRPAFQRLLGDIEAGRVDTVITKDLSRLGRDYILTGHYMERYFPEHGVRYISLLDGIDTGTECSANDITPFRAIMNDMYARDISRKIRSVKREKQRQGQFIGGKPVYGYKMHPTEKNRIVIDEGAAPTVRRIFAMALAGESCRRIAEVLNVEKVPTPAQYAHLPAARRGKYGGLWSGERISEMLRNETYTGSMVQGRRAKVSYKSKKSLRRSPEDWVVVENTHAPLIDGESFRRVQTLLDSRRSTRSRSHDFPLKGLIICHECGYPLGVLCRKNAAGEEVLYFVCRSYQRFTKAGVCSCHSIREKTVCEAVFARVRALCTEKLSQPILREMALKALTERRERSDRNVQRSRLEEKRAALTEKMDRLYMDRLEGLLEETDFRRIYGQLRQEREQTADALHRLEGRAESVSDEQRAEELIRRFLERGCTERDALVSLLERAELTEEKDIILHFRCRPPGAERLH